MTAVTSLTFVFVDVEVEERSIAERHQHVVNAFERRQQDRTRDNLCAIYVYVCVRVIYVHTCT